MSGSVTIGTNVAAVTEPGSWEFDETATALSATTIDEGLSQVRSIQVGTERFINNVVFKEGTNVIFTPTYDAVTDTTTIVVSARLSSTSSDIKLETDADIIDAITDIYGAPIVTVNGIDPDSSGNFIIEGEDCVVVGNITNGVNISNPCSTPCCDTDYLDAAYEALNQINVRYARLVDFYTATDTNISQIQARLALLEAQTGYF